MQLGRFDEHILNAGQAVPGAAVEIRRQGATVLTAQSGTSPFTVNVNDIGAIVDGDTVCIGTGSTTYNVDAVDIPNQIITISGFTGTLAIADDDRLTPVNDLPTLYNDINGAEEKTNPLTTSALGQITAWIQRGHYDYIVSSAGLTTRLYQDVRINSMGPYADGYDARYGLRIDNNTDDGVALNHAMEDHSRSVAGMTGSVFELPKGIVKTSVQVVVPDRIMLIGSGLKTTQIQATGSFPTSTALINLGTTTPSLDIFEYGICLQDVSLDCAGIAGSIGVKGSYINQGSGLKRCSIVRYMSIGILIDTAKSNNFTLEQLDLLHAAGATTAVGISLDTIGTSAYLSDISFNAYDGSTNSTGSAILLDGSCSLVADRIYLERYGIGLNVGAGCRASVNLIQGTPDTVDLLYMDSLANGLTALNIVQGGSTNAINNTRDSHTGNIAHGGFYIATHDGSGGTKSILTSSPSFTSRLNGPFALVSTLAVAGATTLSGAVTVGAAVALNATVTQTGRVVMGARQDIASAASIAIPATGNWFRLTGTTNVTAITGGVAGLRILLEGPSSSSVVVEDSAGIQLHNAANKTLGTDDTLELINDGTIWKQIGQASDN